MKALIEIAAILLAYLIGSFPTALLVAKWIKGVDIRLAGDGNMGAQNTAHVLGFKAGLIVALADVLKGTFAVLIGRAMGLSFGWQMAIGVFAILGHDFPIFAKFKGGQGTATTAGVYLALFPVPTVIGFMVVVLLYLITRKYFLAAPAGGGLMFVTAILLHQPWYTIMYMLILYLCIPLKKLVDSHRLREIQAAAENHSTQLNKR